VNHGTELYSKKYKAIWILGMIEMVESACASLLHFKSGFFMPIRNVVVLQVTACHKNNYIIT